jgi:hypothetical protein
VEAEGVEQVFNANLLMADAKGTYNSPSAQGWATVLPSGPNFLGMATAMENQKLRKQMAEQAAAEKRLADREKGISDLLSDFKDPVTAPQKYQGVITDGYKSMMDKMQKGIAAGRPLGDIRTEASMSYQKLKGEAQSATEVIALVNSIGEMNKGSDYQLYNTDKLKEHVAGKLVGEDGKLIPASQLRLEDLFPDKALYGQGSAGAQFLNGQAVVDNFVQSEAMKEIVVKMQENPTQSRANGMVNTLTNSYSQTSKPFQKLEIDKQGKVKVGIMEPEELIESGIYLAAINDKNMGLIIDAAADEFFANRPIPPTKQEREYEEARILGEKLSGQVGGATYDKKVMLKVNNPSGGGGRMPQWVQNKAEFIGGQNAWRQKVGSQNASDVEEALYFLDNPLGASEGSMSGLNQVFGNEPEFEFRGVITGTELQKNKVSLFGKKFTLSSKAIEPGAMYAKFYDPNTEEVVTKKINQNYLIGESGLNFYNKQANNADRAFGSSSTFDEQVQMPVHNAKGKIKIILPNKK